MKDMLINPPAHEPVSLSEIKDFLKIEGDEEDALLAQLLLIARESCEEFSRRALITQMRAFMDRPAPAMAFPREPVQNVVQVFHLCEGVSTPVSAVDYYLEGGRLIFKRAPHGGEVRIEYMAGYGDDWNAVPSALRQGILRLIAHMHRFRDAAGEGGIPLAVCALWRPYRVHRL